MPFTWHAASATSSYADITYPGVLNNCEQCHLPGTYDFSATASASAVPNRLFRTTATGKFNGAAATTYQLSPYITKDNVYDYGLGFSFAAATGVKSEAAATTLVSSPISTACFSCHDSSSAKAHMTTNGGSVYEARSTALLKTEACLVCHAAGKVADIKAVHMK